MRVSSTSSAPDHLFTAMWSANAIAMCEKSLADGLKTAGIPVVIANWKEENGKGIDDLLASGGAPQYCIY